MKIMGTFLICYALAGCAGLKDSDWLDSLRRENDRVEAMLNPPAKIDDSDKCPPLPKLAEDSTRFEARVNTLTIIALYEQCALSKKK